MVAFGSPQPVSVAIREQFIRQEAARLGIDPDIAVKVARSEGLKEHTWQSNYRKDGVREPSYGDFQLYTGGGLGNAFEKATGLKASDAANWQAMNTYALEQAKKGGWDPWYGAKAVGVTGRQGIDSGSGGEGGDHPVMGDEPYVAPDAYENRPEDPGDKPGSWGDIFSKMGAFGESYSKSTAAAPAAAPAGPVSYIEPGQVNQAYASPPPSGPRRFRRKSNRFADIMGGVNYGSNR